MNETAPAPGTPARRPEDEAPAPAEHDQHTHAHRRIRRGGWMDYAVTMLVALVIAVLVKTFLVQPFFIPSESMVPTLETDDKILVSKLSPGIIPLERGDVIVFEDPDHWVGDDVGTQGLRYRVLKTLSYVGLSPDPADNHLVKRLIGMPGDQVECTDVGGDLKVNGTTITDPYINPDGAACAYAFDVTVPAGRLWVMGDNREHSADSSFHYDQQDADPYVPEDKVTGKAVVTFWPISRWSGLSSGEKAFADVPDPS